MADFFQEKKKNQVYFRSFIDQFFRQSPLISLEKQFDQATLSSLLSSSKTDIIQNNRVSLDRLFELLKSQSQGCLLNQSNFNSIFGTQKHMKVTDFCNILKSMDLDTFDIKEEMTNLFFQDKKWSFKKVDKIMNTMGLETMKQKNKEMMMNCFDFNGNEQIDLEDIDTFIKLMTNRKRSIQTKAETNE